jgi:hypothetical protein
VAKEMRELFAGARRPAPAPASAGPSGPAAPAGGDTARR